MRHMRTARVLFAALALLSVAGVASAQTQTKTQIGGWNIEGEVESGLFGLIQNPNGNRTPGLADGKFEEYRDINGISSGTGLFLENLRLRIFRPDESLSFQISGKDWGLHTQEFHLLGEHIGGWQASFDWDQMRHIYSTDAQATELRFGKVFIIPNVGGVARPPIPFYNLAPPWTCSDPSKGRASGKDPECDGQISQQWYTGRLFFKTSPTPNLDLSAEFTRIYKNGERPFGMAFASPGGNFVEFVQPISQTIYEFKTRGTWARDIFQLAWGYTLSVFVNDFPWVRADNPCNGGQAGAIAGGCAAPGATGQFGTTSLPPNNQAHTVNIAGGVNLPMQTRVNSSLTYQWRFQNEDFQAQTYSNGLVANNLSLQNPQNSLNGNVQSVLFNFDTTSRPLPAPVTFALKYRLYDYHDYSDQIRFQAFIINDQNTITSTPLTAGRYSFLRQNADLSSRYQLVPGTALTLGIGWENWNRSHQFEVTQTDEALAKASFDYTPNDWLMAKTSFTAGFRRGNLYQHNAYWEANQNQPPGFAGSGSNLPEMRKFNEADRNQYIASLLLQITPIDTVSIGPNATYKNTDYVASGLNHGGTWFNQAMLGLQTVVSWNAGMDVSWTPTNRLTFSAGYMFESIFQKQRNRNNGPNDPTMDWISDNTDQFNTYTASMKATVIPEKLTFKVGATYSQSLGRVQTHSPNATGSAVYSANQPNDVAWHWPAFYDQLARLDAALEYNFTKAWSTKFFYAYESFAKFNWQTDSLTPAITPSASGSVFLGQNWRDYTAQILGVTLKYKFE